MRASEVKPGSSAPRITPLDPANFGRAPWKNGGGITVDIAAAYRTGAESGSWDETIWRFGRTAIVRPAPFSDLSGFDRCQVVVAGRGLVLETATGEIDLRQPFAPVHYRGEPPIVSRLEDGPVEVVNLIADRRETAIALAVLRPDCTLVLEPGTHIVYAPGGAVSLRLGRSEKILGPDHALSIVAEDEFDLAGLHGRAVVGSVFSRRP